MTDKLRRGDLVRITGFFEDENLSGVIINGPYPAVFIMDEDGIKLSEETLAVDLMCGGKVYRKVKCSILKKIYFEHKEN